MRGIIALILCLSCYHAYAQNTFDLVDPQGKPSTVEAIVDATKDKKFVFFGEMHGEAASHQLELELIQQLYAQYGNKLVLGMEMFETDVQPIIDEYWKGWINTRSFESEARIWGNYADYRPIVEFARAHQIPLIATNVPRRYANAVYHQGIGVLDSLSDYARSLLPPLPLMVDSTLATYQDLKKMMPGSQAGENMLFSQALKDASMAHQMRSSVAEDQVFIHLNGAYHTKNREGILSFLRDTPSNHMLTIATVSDEGEQAEGSQADFLLLIPAKKERKRKESKREQAAKDAAHPVPSASSR